MCAITLSIANGARSAPPRARACSPRETVFVVQRVYALWGRSKRILMMLCPVFVIVNTANLVDTGFGEWRACGLQAWSTIR